MITPDGRTLVIAESLATRLTAFDIADDGSLSNRRVFAELGQGGPRRHLPRRRRQRMGGQRRSRPSACSSAPGGEVLDRVTTTRQCYACMLGGDDRRTLFMLTAEESGEDRPAARSGRVECAAAATAGRRVAVILHVLTEAAAAEAQGRREYVPPTFAADGFIHCTAGDDLMLQVANRFYASRRRAVGGVDDRRGAA